MQNDSVAAYPVSTVDLLHVDALPKVYCHSYQKMPYSNGLSNHISSCISKSRKGASRERRVQFESTVLLHIGLEDELVMGTVEISSEDLATWNEKPWTKKSKKIKSRKYQDSSCMHPSKFFDVSSNGDTGLAQHPDGQMGRRHSSSSHCNQGFASHLDLTMSRAELSNEDEFSLMQTRLPAGIAFKNAPEDYQNVDIVQAFQEGQMFQQDDPTGSERDHHEDSEGYSPGDGSDFSGAHPPSNDENRQDVLLYHMDDRPIRAMVCWNSYEDMMREIAHHFALDRDALVDAYEVVTAPPDIEPGVVPTIVHINGDIPPDMSGRLVLVDIEYHAHRVEPHFRSGPTVFRHVVPLTRHANRNEVLASARVDRYCRAEEGRCLVYINSRRWPDYDADRKTIAHGDYIKIALPPSDRFACPTEVITDLTQRGLSDQEVYDVMFNDETASGFSPELLDEDEIRRLAVPTSVETNEAHLMQRQLPDTVIVPDLQQSSSEDSPAEFVPPDWLIDLQRVVAPLANCEEERQEFVFSIYTWLVDHQSNEICRDPKIVVLGDDPSEWDEDIREPWKHRLISADHVFMDLVQSTMRRPELEEHVAHVILTKNHASMSSVLISIEFVAVESPSVIVRFALALARESSQAEVVSAVPLLTAFAGNRMEWIVPSLSDAQQKFRTWSGMGLIVKVLPHDEDGSLAAEHDELSMFHISVAPRVNLKLCKGNKACDLNADAEVSGNKVLPFQRKSFNDEPKATMFSLTEEFIRYVQAIGSQVEANELPIDAPAGLQDQPLWVQDIWEKWAETLPRTGEVPQVGPRIETWFSNPRRWSRCRESRIVVLSLTFQHWERELLAAWPDKADLTLPSQFAIVFPTPDDADRTAQEQLVIEQQSEPFSRTIVATLYDTSVDEGRPHSIALVVGDRFDIRSFILLMGYNEVCPPDNEHNECLMWMGNIAIRRDQTVNVRLGNAFKLLVKRGIRVSLQELLSMSDQRLRQELQSAISGQIFRRPNLQSFPADANANGNPDAPLNRSIGNEQEYPPDWLNSLQECFDRYAVVENADEGRIIYILVWFLDGHSYLRNESPRVIRLDSDNAWWRSEIIFPWREVLARGSSTDIHFVDPTPVSEPWQSHAAHIVVSQAIPQDHVPILVTRVVEAANGVTTDHTALVVHEFSSAQDVADRFEVVRTGQVEFTVSRGRNQFPHDLTVRVGPGDGLRMRVLQRSADASSSSHVAVPNPALIEPFHSTRNGATQREGWDDQVDVDLEDAMLMQAYQELHRQQPEPVSHVPSCSSHSRAIGLNEETEHEGDAFQFNPAAPEFLPTNYVLPAWAQAIEDIYHDWDLRAFAWQGEARATHFMTWYLAPGLDRLQCLYGRRIALFADFWNWREQFRWRWMDELDPAAELEIVYVSPPPTQLEAGITGHILLIQHNSIEWSSMLVSVFDHAVNAGHPFHMAHSFPEQIHFQQIVNRIGYADECNNRAQCQYRLRGQIFAADNQILATDGDAVDVLVHRVVIPVGWNPPVIPHMPGAEGLALLQTRARMISPGSGETIRRCKSHDLTAVPISLFHELGQCTDDIDSIPFTLARMFLDVARQAQDMVVCIWQMHDGIDMRSYPFSQFDQMQARLDLCSKHENVGGYDPADGSLGLLFHLAQIQPLWPVWNMKLVVLPPR